MNKKMWIFGTAAAVILTGALLLTSCRQKVKHRKKLAVVSDAGYETAFDVHYPPKYKKPGRKVR
jgi:hypothetical protein